MIKVKEIYKADFLDAAKRLKYGLDLSEKSLGIIFDFIEERFDDWELDFFYIEKHFEEFENVEEFESTYENAHDRNDIKVLEIDETVLIYKI